MNEGTGLVLDKLGNQHAKTEERSRSRFYNSSMDRVLTNVGPKRSISPKIGPVRRISRSPCRITMPRPDFCRQKLPPKPSPRRMSSSPGRTMSSSSSSLADHSMRRSCKPDQSKMSAEFIRSVSPSLSGRKVSRPNHCRSSSKSYPRRYLRVHVLIGGDRLDPVGRPLHCMVPSKEVFKVLVGGGGLLQDPGDGYHQAKCL